MTSTSQAPVVVIGGGLSGLIASTRLAAAGVPVVLLEKASSPGGRAASRHKQGFVFNLGPHGLYRLGHLQKVLKNLGVEVRGGVPGATGGFIVLNGRRHTLPAGLASLLTTGALGFQGKFEWARFLSQPPSTYSTEPAIPNWSCSMAAPALWRPGSFVNDVTRTSICTS